MALKSDRNLPAVAKDILRPFLVGGAAGAVEGTVLVWKDPELTTSWPGGVSLALAAAAFAGAVALAGATLVRLFRRTKWGRAVLGAEDYQVVTAATAVLFFYGAFYLNHLLLPSIKHPLSIIANAALAVGAVAALRFIRPQARKVPVNVVTGLVLATGVFVAGVLAAGPQRLPPPLTSPPPDAPNIVLITLDTTRADRIGPWSAPGYADLTPNLNGLCARGIFARRAYCPMPLTGPSHATIMTGKTPRELGVIQNGIPLRDEFTTLAERLRARGYRTGAVVGAFPLSAKLGFAQGFEFFDDGFAPSDALSRLTVVRLGNSLGVVNTKAELQRPAAEVTRRAISWLGRLSGQTFFLWVHYYDPHTPYEPPAAFRRASTAKDPQIRLYDGEVKYMDAEVGRLLKEIRRASGCKTTWVVAVADHGESLGEHNYFYDHGRDLYEPCARVPLVITRITGEGNTPPNPPGTIPALVTLADLLNVILKLSAGGDYAAANGLARPYVSAEALEENNNLWMMTANVASGRGPRTLKFIYNPATGASELYDLSEPSETTNLVREEETAADILKKKLLEIFKVPASTPGAAASDKVTKDKLKSLGYF